MAIVYNTTVSELLAALNETGKSNFMIIDTEATLRGAGERVFDIAWNKVGFKNGQKQFYNMDFMKNYIVFNALMDYTMMQSISEWKKIAQATANSLYYFYTEIINDKWFSDEFSVEDLEREAREARRESIFKGSLKLVEKKYKVYKSYTWWWGEREYDDTNTYNKTKAEKAKIRLANYLKSEKHYAMLMENTEDVDRLVEQGAVPSRFSLENYKKIAYRQLYERQKKDLELDPLIALADAETKYNIVKESQFGGSIENWKNIMTEFTKDATQPDIYAVVAHNIEADIRFMKNSSKEWDTSSVNIMDDITKVCSLNMYKLFEKTNPELLYNFLLDSGVKENKKYIKEVLKRGQKGGMTSMEVAYPVLMKDLQYEQKHRAKEDTVDLGEMFLELLQIEFNNKK